MAVYQKILQLYRGTNIWDTKNIAKAMVEIYSGKLHKELDASLRDGEPIVAKYYDEGQDGYIYSYGYALYNTTGTTDPYDKITGSATHVWLDGFDSFTSAEFDKTDPIIGPYPKGRVPCYESAAYIRVYDGDSREYTYYELKVSIETTGTPSPRNLSAVYGMALVDTNNSNALFIEWFDSAAEAKGAVSELNYEDKDLEAGFVAVTNQKNGKIETIHGNITGANATVVTDNSYAYAECVVADIPEDWVWQNDSTDTSSTSVPTENVDENSSKYFRVGSGSSWTYYILKKNVSVTLKINDNEKVVWQDNTGLQTTISIQDTTESEQSLPSTVLKRYRLRGIGDANLGDPIDIYKDSSLVTAYVGTMADIFSNGNLTADESDVMYAWTNISEPHDKVYTKTNEVTPGTDKAYIKSGVNDYVYTKPQDIERFENEEIKVGDNTYGSPTKVAAPCVIDGSADSHSDEESLSLVYVLDDGSYQLVNISLENYLQESEFGDGLQVTNHVVSTKLAVDGGIEFGGEAGFPTTNKSLKIKIDTTDNNKYYEKTNDVTPQSGTTYYTYNNSTGQYDVFGGTSFDSNTAYYVKDTYLHISSDGLSIDQPIVENRIVDKIQKVLTINTEGVDKDVDGNLTVKLVGEDITVAGKGSTNTNVDMTEITTINDVVPVYIESEPSPVSASDPDYILTNVNGAKVIEKKTNNGGYAYEYYTVTNNPEYIEVNGLIYKWNGTYYELYYIDKDTNLNDAVAILNYLTYNLDMGQFVS